MENGMAREEKLSLAELTTELPASAATRPFGEILPLQDK